MSSGVAIKSPAVGARPFRNTRTKVFTPYPYSHTFDVRGEDREILPYMARLHSPVRVTFTPGPSAKMKSRVSDQARASVFNFRPLTHNDKPATPIRFKPPDATLPTVEYMSPWVSVTKFDYKDPLNSEYYCDSKGMLTPIVFRRSQTDSDLQSRLGTALSQGRTDTSVTSKLTALQSSSQFTSRPESRNGREVSIKSGSTEKRVTIVDPSETLVNMDTIEQPKPYVSSREASPKARIKNIKLPDCAVNYYSGYLPPELSDKIASELNISTEDIIDSVSEKKDSSVSMFKAGPNYKPLIGDRSLFMRESYPILPKTHHSDIEKLRFEGRERLLQSNGQNTDHFSALKDRGAKVRPTNRAVRFDEAMRKQQRLAKSATISRLPRQQTSIELYQKQKERTYNLQNQAREMINK